MKHNIILDLMGEPFNVRITEVLPDALAMEITGQTGCAQLVLHSGADAVHIVSAPEGLQAICDVLTYYLNERTIARAQNAPSTEEPQ